MLELASLGAKVLQIRRVEVAMKYGVPVHVRSSFSRRPGHLGGRRGEVLEDVVVAGVAYDKSEAQRACCVGVDDKPGVVAKIFGALAEKNISVDMIIQNAVDGGADGADDRRHVHRRQDRSRARRSRSSKRSRKRVGAPGVRYDEDIVKVSIVGLGMRSHAGIAAQDVPASSPTRAINIQAISHERDQGLAASSPRSTPSSRCARCTTASGSTKQLKRPLLQSPPNPLSRSSALHLGAQRWEPAAAGVLVSGRPAAAELGWLENGGGRDVGRRETSAASGRSSPPDGLRQGTPDEPLGNFGHCGGALPRNRGRRSTLGGVR